MFLRLKDSILSEICQRLPDSATLAVSQTCKRLNEIALRAFLANDQISDPTHECTVYLGMPKQTSLSSLHALNIASLTFFHTTQKLTLVFLNADLATGIRDLERAAALLDRLTDVPSVEVELRGSICEDGAAFTKMWLAILRNPSVQTLAMSYRLYPPSALGGTLRMLKSAGKQFGRAFSTWRPHSGRSSIKTLRIGGQLLLLPDFQHLLMFTLQKSPLDSLEIHSVYVNERVHDMAAGLPNLRKLAILDSDLESPALPRLVDARWKPLESPELPLRAIPPLHRVKNLTISLEYLSVFLRQRLNTTIPMDDLTTPARHPSLYLSLHIDRFNILFTVFSAMEYSLDLALAMRQEWNTVFGRTAVSLTDSAVFSRWLALFPQVEEVVWETFSSRTLPHVLGRGEIYRRKQMLELAPLDSRPAQFLNLPDEIISEIFELIPEALFEVGLVCRRFNTIALPMYMVSQKIWDPSTGRCSIQLANYPKAKDCLSALAIALDLPQFKEILVWIPRAAYIYPTINHVRRLIAFVRRASAVETVSLFFGNATPLASKREYMYHDLLNAIVSKPTCTSLNRYASNEQQSGQTNLTAFSFRPSGMLSPVFERWTTAVLRRSRITVLRLDLDANAMDYGYRFVDIVADALPHLRTLEVNGVLLSERNHKISSLSLKITTSRDILENVDSPPPTEPPTVPHLPRTTSISVPLPYLQHLLLDNDPLPSLQHLELNFFITSIFFDLRQPIEIGALLECLRGKGVNPTLKLAAVFQFNIWDRDPTWTRSAWDAILAEGRHPWRASVVGLDIKMETPVSTYGEAPRLWGDIGNEENWHVALLRYCVNRLDGLEEVSFRDNIGFQTRELEQSAIEMAVRDVRRIQPAVRTVKLDFEAEFEDRSVVEH
ncbi:hypothetical protein C8F01DRAFT_1128037 [Mycena amicta]|nr:hypothetical protein C8F01DRAFT_1128037 [Mycena amicta]